MKAPILMGLTVLVVSHVVGLNENPKVLSLRGSLLPFYIDLDDEELASSYAVLGLCAIFKLYLITYPLSLIWTIC